MSDGRFFIGDAGDLCSSGSNLHLHALLLLHEEMVNAAQDDALRRYFWEP